MRTMAGFFETRRAVNSGQEWLKHARHCRHLREDVAAPEALKQLDEAVADLTQALKAREVPLIEKHVGRVHTGILTLMPPKAFAGFRENLEVVVVAIAVAMAFRCYFLQPFKIPTGSMQPTLFGIHYTPQAEPGFFDRGPLRFAKWLVSGEWYTEIKAQSAGTVRGPYASRGDGMAYYDIGGVVHSVPPNLPLAVKPGTEVVTGQIIACGNKVSGDHLFVNRVKWNFIKPARGEVMVFRTDGIPIPRLTEKTHYIKRMCGVPNETISIRAPELLVNGKPVMQPAAIRRIEDRAPGYAGYCVGEGPDALFIHSSDDAITLGAGQYLALGDNTRNSLDGRYWGPVPVENLVGPAMVVYWPFSNRWGWIH